MSQHHSIGLSCSGALVDGAVGKLGGVWSTLAPLPGQIRLFKAIFALGEDQMRFPFLSIFVFAIAISPASAEVVEFHIMKDEKHNSVAYYGVKVTVEGGNVSPELITATGFFAKTQKNHPALAVEACEKDEFGFSSAANCIKSLEDSIDIPDGKSPYQYSYRFIYEIKPREWLLPKKVRTEFTVQYEESFSLNTPDKEEYANYVKNKAKERKRLEEEEEEGFGRS